MYKKLKRHLSQHILNISDNDISSPDISKDKKNSATTSASSGVVLQKYTKFDMSFSSCADEIKLAAQQHPKKTIVSNDSSGFPHEAQANSKEQRNASVPVNEDVADIEEDKIMVRRSFGSVRSIDTPIQRRRLYNRKVSSEKRPKVPKFSDSGTTRDSGIGSEIDLSVSSGHQILEPRTSNISTSTGDSSISTDFKTSESSVSSQRQTPTTGDSLYFDSDVFEAPLFHSDNPKHHSKDDTKVDGEVISLSDVHIDEIADLFAENFTRNDSELKAIDCGRHLDIGAYRKQDSCEMRTEFEVSHASQQEQCETICDTSELTSDGLWPMKDINQIQDPICDVEESSLCDSLTIIEASRQSEHGQINLENQTDMTCLSSEGSKMTDHWRKDLLQNTETSGNGLNDGILVTEEDYKENTDSISSHSWFANVNEDHCNLNQNDIQNNKVPRKEDNLSFQKEDKDQLNPVDRTGIASIVGIDYNIKDVLNNMEHEPESDQGEIADERLYTSVIEAKEKQKENAKEKDSQEVCSDEENLEQKQFVWTCSSSNQTYTKNEFDTTDIVQSSHNTSELLNHRADDSEYITPDHYNDLMQAENVPSSVYHNKDMQECIHKSIEVETLTENSTDNLELVLQNSCITDNSADHSNGFKVYTQTVSEIRPLICGLCETVLQPMVENTVGKETIDCSAYTYHVAEQITTQEEHLSSFKAVASADEHVQIEEFCEPNNVLSEHFSSKHLTTLSLCENIHTLPVNNQCVSENGKSEAPETNNHLPSQSTSCLQQLNDSCDNSLMEFSGEVHDKHPLTDVSMNKMAMLNQTDNEHYRQLSSARCTKEDKDNENSTDMKHIYEQTDEKKNISSDTYEQHGISQVYHHHGQKCVGDVEFQIFHSLKIDHKINEEEQSNQQTYSDVEYQHDADSAQNDNCNKFCSTLTINLTPSCDIKIDDTDSNVVEGQDENQVEHTAHQNIVPDTKHNLNSSDSINFMTDFAETFSDCCTDVLDDTHVIAYHKVKRFPSDTSVLTDKSHLVKRRKQETDDKNSLPPQHSSATDIYKSTLSLSLNLSQKNQVSNNNSFNTVHGKMRRASLPFDKSFSSAKSKTSVLKGTDFPDYPHSSFTLTGQSTSSAPNVEERHQTQTQQSVEVSHFPVQGNGSQTSKTLTNEDFVSNLYVDDSAESSLSQNIDISVSTSDESINEESTSDASNKLPLLKGANDDVNMKHGSFQIKQRKLDKEADIKRACSFVNIKKLIGLYERS